MSKYLICSLLFLSTFLTSYSQDAFKNNVYVRASISEPTVGYQYRINDLIGVGFEAGYMFRYTKEAYIPNRILIFPYQVVVKNLSYRGFACRPVILNFYDEYESRMSISTSYRYLSSDKLIYDPGYMGGSNTSDFAIYAEQKHQIGLSFIYGNSFYGFPRLSWYVEMGAKLNLYERRYSVEGTPIWQIPSNKVTTGKNMGAILNAGLKWNFWNF